MSDYMFMLENHLSAEQNQVVSQVQAAASLGNVSIFLAGGAMRDMLGGFRVRDLDFSVEGNALKLAEALSAKPGVTLAARDEHRQAAELVFPGGVTVQVALARTERYAKVGGKPQITPATIQEDLRGRDFTVNAIALSLNRASRGLLLDPTNGLADLERRELRTVSPYTLYDDPLRLLRLVRLRVRLGFTVEERTEQQFKNVLAAGTEKLIPPRVLFEELHRIAHEPDPSQVIRALDQAGLLALYSPALASPRLNQAGLTRLEKAVRILPDQAGTRADLLGPLLCAMTEKLTPREKAELIRNTEMRKPEVEAWQKLEARSRKLESALKAGTLRKPSQVYQVLSRASVDEICFVLYHSPLKPVQERVRNYYQKYLPMAQAMGPEELSSIAAKPGTAQYEKARQAALATYLDRRPRRVAPPPEEPPPPPEPLPRGRTRAHGG